MTFFKDELFDKVNEHSDDFKSKQEVKKREAMEDKIVDAYINFAASVGSIVIILSFVSGFYYIFEMILKLFGID